MNYHLAPSLLSADFSKLGEEIQKIKQAGADYLHLDVMDGSFVPSISYGMPVIRSIRGCTDLFFDVHLMIEEPERYIGAFAEAGADGLTVHAEACRHLDRTVEAIRAAGLRAAVAYNPATPLAGLSYLLPKLDMVLVMSVNPGFGGQKFLPYALDKVREARRLIDGCGHAVDLQVDGGVSLSNAGAIIKAGANVLVSGAALFRGDLGGNIRLFGEVFEQCR